MTTTREYGTPKPELWLVHSGCTNHVCAFKPLFSFFNENCSSTVRFSDGSSFKAQGKGNVIVKTENGSLVTITNVLYVPTMNRNILSVGQLASHGNCISMGGGKCEIFDSAERCIASCELSPERVLYSLKFETIEPGSVADTNHFVF